MLIAVLPFDIQEVPASARTTINAPVASDSFLYAFEIESRIGSLPEMIISQLCMEMI